MLNRLLPWGIRIPRVTKFDSVCASSRMGVVKLLSVIVALVAVAIGTVKTVKPELFFLVQICTPSLFTAIFSEYTETKRSCAFVCQSHCYASVCRMYICQTSAHPHVKVLLLAFALPCGDSDLTHRPQVPNVGFILHVVTGGRCVSACLLVCVMCACLCVCAC